MDKISKIFRNAFPAALLALLLVSQPALSLEKKAVSVGVVNVVFLMENAPQSELASNRLKEKFLPQEKKLAEELEIISSLEAELKERIAAKTISPDEKRQKERELRARKRSRTRSLQDFREELRFARDAALDDVQKEVFSAIDDVRKQQKIDIVIQDFISASKRVDITPLVLEYLKNKLLTEQAKTENARSSDADSPSENEN